MDTPPLNHINAGGGLNLCIAGGGCEKALECRYRLKMHVRSPIFQGQLVEEKTDNFNILGAREGCKKCQKKG